MAVKGRKNKYDTNVKPNLALITEMCRTMTEKQIAQELSVSYSTFNQYKTEHKELVEAIKKGRQNLVAELRSSLIKKALGYQYTETKIVTEKIKWPKEEYEQLLEAGLTEEQITLASLVRKEVINKKVGPDVAAINLALKNYDDTWRNDPAEYELKRQELELKKKKMESEVW